MLANPWKAKSKINPQRESGDRRIANDVFLALIRAPLSAAELKICLYVISETWGWSRHTKAIPVAEFMTGTQLAERTVRKSLADLERRRMVYCGPSSTVRRGSPVNEYGFNKHFDTWREAAQTPF